MKKSYILQYQMAVAQILIKKYGYSQDEAFEMVAVGPLAEMLEQYPDLTMHDNASAWAKELHDNL